MLVSSRRLVAVVLVFVVILSGCGGSAGPGKPQGPQAGLAGSYELVGDVGGTRVNQDATVTLTLLPDGKLTVKAVQPGEEVTDTGSWSTDGQNITIEFTDMQLRGKGRYSYDGTTLRLPLRVLSDGEGDSEWKRVGASPSQSATGSPSREPAAKADWSMWDLKKDAAAVGTRTYAEAVQGGAEPVAAVRDAMRAVEAVPGVRATVLSESERSFLIDYEDGDYEYVFTERLETESRGDGASRLAGNWSSRSVPADACPTLPGTGSTPGEPGREAVGAGVGLYGVARYDQSVQPRPLHDLNTPDARRALLVAPQYDVRHPIGDGHSTIREVTGDNIECIGGLLSKAGYEVKTVLGKPKTATANGTEAIKAMHDLLTKQDWGVFYFLGHGSVGVDPVDQKTSVPALFMGRIDIDEPEIGKILKGKKITKKEVAEAAKVYTERLGLTWSDERPPLWLAPDNDGSPSVVVMAYYFEQLRDKKKINFAQTLMWVNACNSGTGNMYATMTGAAAFTGWKAVMSGEYIALAAATVFDMLTDKARTLRAAQNIWMLHERWVLNQNKVTYPDPNVYYGSLTWLGKGAQTYLALSPQTHILVLYLRHGPSSATSDIRKAGEKIQACWDQFWSSGGGGALKSPFCHGLQYGKDIPTVAEIDDALAEVGLKDPGAAGRWTLAD